jgi:hypothetical protein
MKTRIPTSRSMRGRMTRSRILAAITVRRWMCRITVCAVAWSNRHLLCGRRMLPRVVDRAGADRCRKCGAGARHSADSEWSHRIPVGSGTWMMSLLPESAIELCDGRRSDLEQQGTRFGGGRYCPSSTRLSISPRGRLGVNWNEFSARRYRGRTLQNAVTPTALNVARSLDLCCVQ